MEAVDPAAPTNITNDEVTLKNMSKIRAKKRKRFVLFKYVEIIL